MPLFFACYPNERGKVKRSIIADIFVVCFQSGSYEEISDSLVNVCLLLQISNKWTNVLKCSSTNDFRSGVLQESVVENLKFITRFNSVEWSYFSHLGNNISTSLSDFPLFVLCQLVIKREDLLSKYIK